MGEEDIERVSQLIRSVRGMSDMMSEVSELETIQTRVKEWLSQMVYNISEEMGHDWQ